jgi:membrane-associated phospholipid phosphatase
VLFSLSGLWLIQLSKADSFLWVNGHRHHLADLVFSNFTHVGDGLFNLAVALIFLLISYRWSLHFLGGFVLSSLLSILCKEWWFKGWPRPKLYFEILEIPIQFVEGITVHSHNSFPSGHTLTAFSVFALLSAWRPKPFWSIMMLLFAVLAGYSRVYLAQHFPQDVLVGSLAGLTCSIVSFQLIEKYLHRSKTPWADGSLLSSKK